MISKQQQKYVQSLHNKKYRREFNAFLVEGEKGIVELLNSDFEIQQLYCTEKFAVKYNIEPSKYILADTTEIEKISTLKSNDSGVAVVSQKAFKVSENPNQALILDDINDPGNLGTIIRLADWYGINNIICSENTVEFYNPKTIAASMGSFVRVNCAYVELEVFLSKQKTPVYGAFLEGKNVHKTMFQENFLLMIGSESHGITDKYKKYVGHKITIPRIGMAESLNAGVATGIILDNIFRNK